jgi:hypothetical protein
MSRSRRRAAAALVVVCALTGLTALTGAAAAGTASAAAGGPAPAGPTAPLPATTHTDDDALPVSVEITAVTPQVLRPTEQLTVTARLTNTTDAEVAQPRVFLHVDQRTFISRSSLDRWRTAPLTGELGGVAAEVDTGAPLPPGASVAVTATVPADALGLGRGERAWGPRGVALQIVDAADPARVRLGAARTFALWFPVEQVTATRMSVLVPLVGPAVDPYTTDWAEGLEGLTTDGRLARALDATEEQSDITWVVDPWLLEVADAGDGLPGGADGTGGAGADGTDRAAAGATGEEATDAATGPGAGTTPGAIPTAAELPATSAWAARLLEGTTDREVHLLPYLDADVTALAHADAGDVLALARERTAEVARASGLPGAASGLVAWPAVDLPDLATAAFVQTDGARAVVVGPGQLLPPAVLTYTPSGRATVSTSGGDVTALVPDERLSAGLRTGSLLPDDDGPRDEKAQRTPATAAQDLLAELAVITRERPTDGRHVLATLPRDWAPRTEVVEAQLAALAGAPWVRMEPVTALVGAPDGDVDRGSLPRRDVGAREVPGRLLEDVATAVADRADLAGMVADPQALLGDGELELLAPASVAWRSRPQERAALADRARALTAALGDAVAVVPGSDLTIISTSAGMPIRLTNALDQDVSVVVDLRPDSSRLRSDGTVPVTVPANGEQVVQIPVHAISSADVAVTVEVRTPEGVLVDDDTVIAVRVRADWEGIGTLAIGALLALGLVVGLVRSIRRGRTGRRAQPQLDSGPDALSPEATLSTDPAVTGGATTPPVDHTGAGDATTRETADAGAPDGSGAAGRAPEGRGAG